MLQKFYSKGSKRIVLFDTIHHSIRQLKYVNDQVTTGAILIPHVTDQRLQSLVSDGLLQPYFEATAK